MIRVRMLQQMSGTRNGEPWPEVGAEFEVGREEAEALCAGQTPIAVVVPPEPVKHAVMKDGKVQEPEQEPEQKPAAEPAKTAPKSAARTTQTRSK